MNSRGRQQENVYRFCKMNIRRFSCVAVLLLAAPSQAQDAPTSPCPSVFQYDTSESEPGRWYGNIKLSTDTTLQALYLGIVLDKKADILGNWIGDITTRDNTNFVIKNTKMTIYPDQPITLRFYVKYNVVKLPAPKLKSIQFNGVDICNADNPGAVVISRPKPNTSSEPFEGDNITGGQEQCGKVVKENINTLIVAGTATSEGDWPWHIALYETTIVNNQYICGGTLVSHYHVITAGHCVTRRDQEHPRGTKNVNTLSVYLGKYNLRDSVEGVQFRQVYEIIRHPEYNSSSFRRDVAIMRLRQRVTYTAWVQPACLWPEDQTSISNIVGKAGSVVGWGRDERGSFNPELALVNMPVVTSETCLRSLSTFFASVTSEYTYCAGSRDGPSVCNGDSGGGMVFRLNGIWHLRGLVSLSKSIDGVCDPSHYVVFTDLAKFLPWLKENIA